MKLTKYKHACLVIEKDEKNLIIDPGNLSTDFVVPKNVVAVVVTHEHPDHLDVDTLQKILNANPAADIFGPAGVIDKITFASAKTVNNGDVLQAGPFELEFFGEKHELFHLSLPVVDNVGVMVNNTLYYPGDSYVRPNKPVDVLALPLSGPWLKTGDAIDFALVIAPKQAFPTHDAHLSNEGMALVDMYVPMLTKASGMIYERLSEPLEI